MATKVFMEALSPTMEEGRLVKWIKSEGDAVKSGETLAEVETDKAIMELVARGDGILRRRLVDEGATTPVGALIGVIATADENIDALLGGAPPAPPAAAPAAPPAAPPAATPAPAAPPAGASLVPVPARRRAAPPAAPAAGASRAPRATPSARRLATDRGVA